MTETLAPQNEPQPWQQELQPHHESSSTLKKDEALALMGSWVEEGFESATELHDSGGTSDIEYSVQKRIKDAAISELSLLDLEDQNVYSAMAERQKALEEQLYDKGANKLMIRAKLDGLRLLEDTYKNIENHVGPLSGDRHVRVEAINEMIDNHNKWISRDSETTSDSPEIQEAQERINNRYAEQAKRPQQAETVDDARQKVTEAFSGTREVERSAIIAEVARAAQGSTRIHTDIPKGLRLKSTTGDYYPNDGFNTFGDGIAPESGHKVSKLRYEGSAEAFMIEPATTTRYRTVTKNVETGSRFRKRTEQVEERLHDGEVPAMVTNPVTGQQEPGVKVGYQFNGNKRGGYGQSIQYEGPEYITESRRGGNQLFVEAVVPKSVADKLKQAVKDNPDIAREFAKSLALNNGITEQSWSNGVQPPFDKLPDDWKMTLVEMQKDTQYGDERHTVVSEQAVKASR